MKKIFSSLLSKIWPYLIISAVVLAFFWPVWLQGKVPLPGDFVVGVYYPWLDYKWGFITGVPVKNPITTDVVSFMYPMQMLAIDLLKSGEWPLWNPYILAGTPLLANFQSAPFSPTNFVYFVFDRLTAWSIQIMLQHFFAALFVYLLLRVWKVSKIGSVFGGIAFAFAGFNLIWSEWNGHALSAAFIPLLILLEYLWFQKPRWWVGSAFSVSVALQILSGYPQVVFYTAVGLGFLALFMFKKEGGWWLRAIGLAIYGILGSGLAAFQILPGAQLLRLSQRAVEPHPFEWAFLPFEKVITFFAPDYYGNHSTQNYWGPQDYTSNTGFVSVVAFVLAAIAVRLWKSRQEVGYIIALLTISLLLAFPTPLSIFLWKSGWFGLNAASAHRSLVLFNLSIAVLAGIGTDRFLKQKVSIFPSYLIPAVVLAGFGLFTLVMWRLSSLYPEIYSPLAHGFEKYKIGLRNLVWPAGVLLASLVLVWWGNKSKVGSRVRTGTVWLLLLLLAADLFRFGWKFTPFSGRNVVFPTTPVLDYLQAQPTPFRTTGSKVIPINMRMPYKIETIEGYDAVYPLEISQFIAAITSKKSGTDPVGRYGTIGDETERVLNLVNVKYDVVIKRNKSNQPDPQGLVAAYFEPKQFPVAFEDKSVAVLENKDVLPRAFMVYDWEISKGPKTLDKLLSADFPQSKKILLESEPNITIVTEGKSIVDYIKYSENSSEISVITDKNGLLFVSDTYFPGWKVYIDGIEKEILRANFAFRGVEIPIGRHIVKFRYQPEPFFNGLKISSITVLLLALFSIYTLKKV